MKTAIETTELVLAIRTLDRQGIRYQGPFRTASGRVVFCLEDQIVLDTELIALLAEGELNPDGISALLRHLRKD